MKRYKEYALVVLPFPSPLIYKHTKPLEIQLHSSHACVGRVKSVRVTGVKNYSSYTQCLSIDTGYFLSEFWKASCVPEKGVASVALHCMSFLP